MATSRQEIIQEGRRIVRQLEQCRASTEDGTRQNRTCAINFRDAFNRLFRSILGQGLTAGARIRARNQLRNALMNDPQIRRAIARIGGLR